MRTAGLDEAQAGFKIARRNINNLRYADNMILMAESKEELKSFLMKVIRESEKVGLKLNIQRVNPWLIHVNVWQKPLQYFKIISLQLIKINGKKTKLNIQKTKIMASGPIM